MRQFFTLFAATLGASSVAVGMFLIHPAVGFIGSGLVLIAAADLLDGD